jgi:hypothetical protein
MNDLYHLADRYADRCKRELSELLPREGLVVMDPSFLAGFVRRRVGSDGFYPSPGEALYIEAKVHEHFYNNLPDNVVFPEPARREYSDGIKRLIASLDNPHNALANLWGGPGGEPTMTEHKSISGDIDDVGKQLINFIKVLQMGENVQRNFTSEAYRAPPVSLLVGETSEFKRYHNPAPVHHHGAKRRDLSHICTGHSFQHIHVKPLSSVRAASRNKGNDDLIFNESRRLSQIEPVTIMTADIDYKNKHRGAYGNGEYMGHGVTVVHDGTDYLDILRPACA